MKCEEISGVGRGGGMMGSQTPMLRCLDTSMIRGGLAVSKGPGKQKQKSGPLATNMFTVQFLFLPSLKTDAYKVTGNSRIETFNNHKTTNRKG